MTNSGAVCKILSLIAAMGVVLLPSCKPKNSAEVKEGAKLQTITPDKIEFQYYGGTDSIGGMGGGYVQGGAPTGGLSPSDISQGTTGMKSVTIIAFEKALEGLKKYTLGFNSVAYDVEIKKVVMIETERLAFSADGKIALGAKTVNPEYDGRSAEDISSAMVNAGFKVTGLMSRYTMKVDAEMRSSNDAITGLTFDPGEYFDFWYNTLSFSLSAKFDGATILGAFLKANPQVLSKFLPILNNLADVRGGTKLDTLRVSLAQSKKIVYPEGWAKEEGMPLSSYLIAKRIYSKICKAKTENKNSPLCVVPELAKLPSGQARSGGNAATEASLKNYAVAPALKCEETTQSEGSNKIYNVFIALPKDGTQDIGFQSGQKVHLYKVVGSEWSKTGEWGTMGVQPDDDSKCSGIRKGAEKCFRVRQGGGMFNKQWPLCSQIKLNGEKAVYGYSSLATMQSSDVKPRL